MAPAAGRPAADGPLDRRGAAAERRDRLAGRSRGSVGPRGVRDGPRRLRAARPGPPGLPVAARHAAPGRLVAEDDGRARGGGRGRGDRPRGRESSRRLPRGRRLAPLPRDRRPRLRAPDVADCPGGDRLGARAADAARRGGLGARRGRPAGRVRAALRVLEHPPGAALRARAGRAGRRAAARLGALGRPARPRARPPSRGVRRQEPVLDGLVLPGARRRAPRRRPARSCWRPAGTPSSCPVSASAASATSPG